MGRERDRHGLSGGRGARVPGSLRSQASVALSLASRVSRPPPRGPPGAHVLAAEMAALPPEGAVKDLDSYIARLFECEVGLPAGGPPRGTARDRAAVAAAVIPPQARVPGRYR